MAFLVSMATTPYPGEFECGDLAAHWCSNHSHIFCMIDGLGHGAGAAQAARQALGCLTNQLSKPLEEAFLRCNEILQASRGVAVGIAMASPDGQRLVYAGVGNTRAMVAHADGSIERLSSNNGILGAGYQPLACATVRFAPGDTLLMFTDGLPEMLDFGAAAPRLFTQPAHYIRHVLHQWRSERDDAGLLICHYEADRVL
ncbi:SpoIIE family protein phosphatase [Thiorhodospira sibirica]|uniref:SpoIIE family protein phosphatase n=1 Tax=Thiorhodospira sibirica TaxID=154347 RepID=UPI00022C1D33|nr:SpoIIE family protein phosphatase [Thiorhodospira sibirica]